jgi:hypothetical protein
MEGCERLTGLICSVGFIVGFKVDNWAWWLFAPLLRRRTEDEPSQIVDAISMPALVSDEVKPVFVAKFVSNPMQPLWLHGNQSVVSVTENCSPDTLPPFRSLAEIVAIASQNPDDMVSAPTGDDVFGESDEVFFRQERRWRWFPQLPQNHRCSNQTVAVDSLHFLVEPLEKAGVDLDSLLAHEGGFTVLIVRKCPPLGADELNCSEALFTANLQVALPIFRLRFQDTVPSRVSEPEERSPVGVHEVAAVGRKFDGAVTVKWVVAFVRDALEGARFAVQATVCRVGAFRLPTPFAQFVGAKPHLPDLLTIPKGFNDVPLARRETN